MEDFYDACGNPAIDASAVRDGALVRVTRESPPRLSVLDLVTTATGRDPLRARKLLMPSALNLEPSPGLPEDVSQRARAVLDVLYNDCNVYKFKGRGQRFSPVVTGEAAKDLVRAVLHARTPGNKIPDWAVNLKNREILGILDLWLIDVQVAETRAEQTRAEADEAHWASYEKEARRQDMESREIDLRRQMIHREMEIRGLELLAQKLRKEMELRDLEFMTEALHREMHLHDRQEDPGPDAPAAQHPTATDSATC